MAEHGLGVGDQAGVQRVAVRAAARCRRGGGGGRWQASTATRTTPPRRCASTSLLTSASSRSASPPARASVGLLEQLALAYVDHGDEVVYPWPSFIAYPQFTRLAGGAESTVALRRQAFDPDAVVAAMSERTRVVLLANPNNPTSTALRTADLQRVVDAAPDDCLVVVDEAYREFVTGADVPDAIELFGERPNVAVLRTLSKAYGLAGLRVGFLVADPGRRRRRQRVRHPVRGQRRGAGGGPRRPRPAGRGVPAVRRRHRRTLACRPGSAAPRPRRAGQRGQLLVAAGGRYAPPRSARPSSGAAW